MDSVIVEGSFLHQYLVEEGIEHDAVPSLAAAMAEDTNDESDPTIGAADDVPDEGTGVQDPKERRLPDASRCAAAARHHDEVLEVLTASKSFLAVLVDDFGPISAAPDRDTPTGDSAASSISALAAVAGESARHMVRIQRLLNKLHRSIRDAELVARGYRLALPLPPIHRIERNQARHVDDLQCLPLRHTLVTVATMCADLASAEASSVERILFDGLHADSSVSVDRIEENAASATDHDAAVEQLPSSQADSGSPSEETAKPALEQADCTEEAPGAAAATTADIGRFSLRGLKRGNRNVTASFKQFWMVLLLTLRHLANSSPQGATGLSLDHYVVRMDALTAELCSGVEGLQMLGQMLADSFRGHKTAQKLKGKREQDLAARAWSDRRVGASPYGFVWILCC